jgi:small subunit ribosomal protein S16
MSRHGAKKQPFFHLVATDSRKPRDGRFIELVGTYDPRKKEIRLKKERLDYWLSKGALPSATVKQVLKKAAAKAGAAA